MLNQTFNELKLEQHTDKTLIGRIERGFDFLGYHFDPEGLSVAKKTVDNFLSRAIRLYEQEPGEAIASARLGVYVQRWVRWVRGGLPHGATMRQLWVITERPQVTHMGLSRILSPPSIPLYH